MEECPPNCYAKVVEAVSKTQYESTQDKLDVIIGNQNKIDNSVQTVAAAIINIGNLTKTLDEHKADAEIKFNEVFIRLRKVEAKQAWIGGGIAATVAVVEGLRLFNVL